MSRREPAGDVAVQPRAGRATFLVGRDPVDGLMEPNSWSSIFLRAAIAILLMVCTRWGLRALWSSRGRRRRHSVVLHAGKAPLVAGGALVVMGPLICWLFTATARPEDEPMLMPFYAVAAVFSCFGALFMLRASRSLVLVSAAGAAQFSLFGGQRHVAWRSVVAVRHRSAGAIELVGKATKVTVGTALVGFPDFVEALERHLPSELTSEAIGLARRDMTSTLGTLAK